jgi:hypothetical protein
MLPLSIFLLGCGAVYLGSIEAAFSALMRLSLRLVAERTGRPDALGDYLDDPLLLFVPVRLLLGFVTASATVLLARAVGIDGAHTVTFVVLCGARDRQRETERSAHHGRRGRGRGERGRQGVHRHG